MIKKIFIIGAGLAGLSAGCYAQMNGFETEIYEKNVNLGGSCTAWKRKGYMIDGCINWLMNSKSGSSMNNMYRELGIKDFILLKNFLRIIDERNDETLQMTIDLSQLEKDLYHIANDDSKEISQIIKNAKKMQLFKMDVDKPNELFTFVDKMKSLWRMRNVLQVFRKYNMSVNEYVKKLNNPMLINVLRNLFLPDSPMSFALMILGQLANGEMGLHTGGSLALSETVGKLYIQLGGKINYKSSVSQIIVYKKKAVGIRLENGKSHFSDIVISTAPEYNTIIKLLDGKFISKSFQERYESWQLSQPLLLVSFGVANEFPNHPMRNLFILKNPFTIGKEIIKQFQLRIENVDRSQAPAGKTTVQAIIDTNFDFWWNLKDDKEAYIKEKQRIIHEVLIRIEAHFPGFKDKVEMTDVSTPYTLAKKIHSYKGAHIAFLPTLKSMLQLPKKYLENLDNFYMAGQWLEFGGGVPSALMSGRHLVQIICNNEDIEFKIKKQLPIKEKEIIPIITN